MRYSTSVARPQAPVNRLMKAAQALLKDYENSDKSIEELKPSNYETDADEFDLDEFVKIPTVYRMYANANKLLNKVSGGKGEGTGSARVVFDLPFNQDKVLKIGYGSFGQYQNNREAQLQDKSEYFTEVYDADKDMKWIIAEKVIPFNSEEEFYNYFGFTPFDIQTLDITAESSNKDITEEMQDWFVEQGYTIEAIEELFHLHNVMNINKVLPGDFADWEHWGISIKDGMAKLFDYGADTDLLDREDAELAAFIKSKEQQKQVDRDAKTASFYTNIFKLAFEFSSIVDSFSSKASKGKIITVLKNTGVWPLTIPQSKDKVWLRVEPNMKAYIVSNNGAFAGQLNNQFSKELYNATVALQGTLHNGRFKDNGTDTMFTKPDETINIPLN